jgi:hypothetical protein
MNVADMPRRLALLFFLGLKGTVGTLLPRHLKIITSEKE